MPVLLFARPSCDAAGERTIRKLAGPGQPRRLTELERGRIVALAAPSRPAGRSEGEAGLDPPEGPTAPARNSVGDQRLLAAAEAAEGWWRLLRRQALAGQTVASAEAITLATRVATAQLNARARPWIWGRPPAPTRRLRRVFTYRL